jgi:hypothetical protein
MSASAIIAALIDDADMRYGPFASTHEALGVACEEWDELRAAVHANDMVKIKDEALDLAAVLIRLHDQLARGGPILRRSGA